MNRRIASLELQRVTSPAPELAARFGRWSRDAEVDPKRRGLELCKVIAERVNARGPDHEVNYVIVVDGRVVGGIHTSGEYFNVIWIHWEATGRGLGARVTRRVLASQLDHWGCAYVNKPNAKMCKALRQILVPERASELIADVSIRLEPGDLRPPAPQRRPAVAETLSARTQGPRPRRT